MAHRIYTGAFAALEARLIDLVLEQQAGDTLAPVAVLTGSNILATYLKGRLADRRRAVANVCFYTFPDLVAKLGSGAQAGNARPRLPHLGASLLLDAILDESTPAPFLRVAGYGGFHAALLDTFRDLRDAGVTPDALEKALSQFRDLTPDRVGHLFGLADIYRRFKERVASFHEVTDDFGRAISSAPHAGDILGTRALLVYGIYDVTGTQADLLRALQGSIDLTYLIPFTGESASRFASHFLESRADELGVAPLALPPAERTDSLGKLANRMFAPPEVQADPAYSVPLKADGSYALVSVPGESRIAVEVIREVLGALNDGVITGFYEAAVILRRPDEEVPVLAEAFRLRSIPYFVQGGSAFAQRPLARAVLAIAGLEGETFSRRAVLTAMELVAAALPAAQAVDWDVPRWRSLVKDARFLAGCDSWETGCAALVPEARVRLRRAEADAASTEQAEEDGDDLLSPSVEGARRRVDVALSLWKGWAALRSAAGGWPEACMWREWADLLQSRLEPLLGRAADWPEFSNVFDDLRALGELPGDPAAGRKVTRVRLIAALSEELAGLSFPEGRFQRRGVNLLPAAAARGLRFPLVIIPGLDEGRFPARLRQDPLLLDTERPLIGRPPRLPLKSLRVEEERLLFDVAVRSAERRLVLMTSRLDEASDRERIPSQFFLRSAAAALGAAVALSDLTPGNVPGMRSVSLDAPGPGKGRVPVDEGEIRLGLITEDPASMRAALEAVARVEPQLLGGPMAYDQARWLRKLTRFDGSILDPSLRSWAAGKLLGGGAQLSASRVEEYARCPYFSYLRRVLELEKWEEEEPVEGLDPLVRGQIVHAVLEDFVRDVRGFAGAPLAVLQQELARRAHHALEEGRPAAMPDLLWEIERDRLVDMLNEWLRFETERAGSGFQPVWVERCFGSFPGESDSPPFRLQDSRVPFEFRGRIDRIDLSPDGRHARIIDYKTGALPKSMSGRNRTPLMAGERIQLAVYRGAISVMEDLSAVRDVEAEYLHLQSREGEPVPCGYRDDELRAALERLPEMLAIIRDGIDAGTFFARARGSVRPDGHCRFCDFLLICGKDREQRQAAKASDPAVARFSRLQMIDGVVEEEE